MLAGLRIGSEAVTDVNETEDTLTFTLRTDQPLKAVALRNAMLSIPSFAIDDVRVYANEGSVADELLAHSLGLVPVIAHGGDRVSIHSVPASECICGGSRCRMCSAVFMLDVLLAGEKPRTIYSHDFVPVDPTVVLMRDIPLTELEPGKRIQIQAFALFSKSGETKWQVCAPPPFWTNPIYVHLNPARELLTPAQHLDLVAACPRKVFDIEDGVVVVNRSDQCTGCGVCVSKGYDYAHTKEERAVPLVRLEYDTEVYKFRAEMTGQLKPGAVRAFVIGPS